MISMVELYIKGHPFSFSKFLFFYYFIPSNNKHFFINTKMSLAVINLHQDELANEHTTPSSNILANRHRRLVIKKKVIAIGKLSRQLSVLRENPDMVKEIKRLNGSKLPLGTLSQGEQGLRQALAMLEAKERTPNDDSIV
ncbi:hypothetical protein BDA99DRAFT_528758 [Phascolomyces articulosus]|uniref:Uncharacterized protein n=1 Tax=Phascolomyces articulosus TaxID=60185 RepID=A0AAD5JM77_9FUNG|nr:hypothetical protein BDA99DRAFT_528758 [Phascolomyces articulosus]